MERENRESQARSSARSSRDEDSQVAEEQTSFHFIARDSAAREAEEGRIADQSGNEDEVPDASIPDSDDWKFRPYSASERYTNPNTEIEFAQAMTIARPNYPAIAGVVLAVLGFVPGLPGLILAIAGICVSGLGVIAARNGAERQGWAVGGMALGLALTLAHWLVPY